MSSAKVDSGNPHPTAPTRTIDPWFLWNRAVIALRRRLPGTYLNGYAKFPKEATFKPVKASYNAWGTSHSAGGSHD